MIIPTKAPQLHSCLHPLHLLLKTLDGIIGYLTHLKLLTLNLSKINPRIIIQKRHKKPYPKSKFA